MSIANKLYDRSHGFVGDVNATNPDDLPALYITGSLPDAPTGEAYEGRLQIHNAVGSCTVKLLSGTLPPGNTVSVDNQHSQVVIKWPSFKAGTADIPNNNFSKGDDGSWELGPGWSIMSGVTPPDPNDPGDTHQAQFDNLTGESAILSNFLAPVADAKLLGAPINASVDVQQGASSANKAGAAVRVLFYDEVGFQVGGADGEVVKSGSDSNWATSHLKVSIPSDAVYARIGASAYRKSQNRTLWVDNLKWDLVQAAQGTATPGSITISVQVIDSLNRVAVWSGSIYMPNVFIEALHYFNTNPLLDDTGNTWQYFNGNGLNVQDTITDRWGAQPAVVPYLTSAPPIGGDFAQTLEGAASFSTCPNTKNHDGSFDYPGTNDNGVIFTFGSKAPGMTEDFCIEMYVRRNELALQANLGLCFTLLGGMRFNARMTTDTLMTMESGNWVGQTGQSANPLVKIYDNNANTKLPIGLWFHHAITRSGDIVTAYVNGIKYVQWSGGSNWNLSGISSVVVGHGLGGSSSYVGFGGQYDGFRYTRNWARYNSNFTPPTLPY